ncbi:hypothetical protein [Burkholderia sp. MBR-1]|uniref:hypothetical protein n=1 Tax=Burkholderia sp. MBR-1 TaxID=2732364 RepID=UPI0015EEC468|nr:hypothetical protein [Burkholderia sp. MBR-1]QMI44676.1 hypothetical protein MBR110_04085 [Burkholderia sp. MBR-1]
MVKVIRASAKISETKALAIIAELERWRDRELGTKLTWGKIEAFSGYTRQALSRHPNVKMAYDEAKRALADPTRVSSSRSRDEEQKYFDQTVKDLEGVVKRYQALEQTWFQRWQRIAIRCIDLGLSIEDLDKPIDDLNRRGDKSEATRGRRGKQRQ